jgi:uncharacterized membrane protein
MLGLRVNGHPGLVRPLLAPMVQAAAQDPDLDRLKAACAASENYGNFYGQNLSPVAPGLLLVATLLPASASAPRLRYRLELRTGEPGNAGPTVTNLESKQL